MEDDQEEAEPQESSKIKLNILSYEKGTSFDVPLNIFWYVPHSKKQTINLKKHLQKET